MFTDVKTASRTIAALPDSTRSDVLRTLARLIVSRSDAILAANSRDLARMPSSSPLCDRLRLTPSRLQAIAADILNVASLPSPVGEEIERRTLPNGILLRRVRVPFGVIGVIYEARPNVTFDVFSLCLKSGNACVLKGGKDAEETNLEAISIIHESLAAHGISPAAALMLPATHEATAAMLGAVGFIDVCIPRGGRSLIDFVRNNARIPVIETGAGVVHAYFDREADIHMGRDIILNAKTRRVSVCNALDTLLIHRDRLADLPALCAPLADKNVVIHADPESLAILSSAAYPAHLLTPALPADWDREWMDYSMGLRTVSSLSEAISHIARHGSGHSECIMTSSPASAARFQAEVDAACVYVNAPTGFTDGAQFGLGAEIGISTQKLGPRGPMGLREITTTRYLLTGNGQTRE